MKAKRRKWLKVLMALTVAAVLVACALPSLYRRYTVSRLKSELDQKYGSKGWVVLGVTADLQPGEKINLYRTAYVRLVYPRFQDLTPWPDVEFTHKTSCSIRPWHFVVSIATRDCETTFYWSMRQNRWVEVWHNQMVLFRPEVQATYARLLNDVVRVDGLNEPVYPPTPNDPL